MRMHACCRAEGSTTTGSAWLTWSTGFFSFVQNAQAPAYPTSLYAPQTPDPASVASVVTAPARPAPFAVTQPRSLAVFFLYWVQIHPPVACPRMEHDDWDKCHEHERADRLALAWKVQVQWGLTAGGPYPNTASGYAQAYIQVCYPCHSTSAKSRHTTRTLPLHGQHGTGSCASLLQGQR